MLFQSVICNPIRWFLILGLLTLGNTTLWSESILLRKGGTVKGKIVDQDQSKIRVQKPDGSSVNISKNDILKVIYKENLSQEEEEKLRRAAEEKEKDRSDKEKLEKEKAERERLEKEKAAEEQLAKEKAEKEKEKEAQKKKEREAEAKLTQERVGGLSRAEAVASSTLLPGWGQYKQNRKLQAYLYPTLLLLGLFATYEKNREFQNALRDYNNLNNPYSQTGLLSAALGVPSILTAPPVDPVQALVASETSQFRGQRESVDRHYRELQIIGGLTVGIYLWNIFDALLFHPNQIIAKDIQNGDRTWILESGTRRMDPWVVQNPFSSWETQTRAGLQWHF